MVNVGFFIFTSCLHLKCQAPQLNCTLGFALALNNVAQKCNGVFSNRKDLDCSLTIRTLNTSTAASRLFGDVIREQLKYGLIVVSSIIIFPSVSINKITLKCHFGLHESNECLVSYWKSSSILYVSFLFALLSSFLIYKYNPHPHY